MPLTTLTHSPAHVVRQLLIDLALGVATDGEPWVVKASAEPDVPDEVITVFDTAGQSDGRVMVDGELQEHQGIQVRIRSKDHPTGWARADRVQSELARNVYDRTVHVGSEAYLVHSLNQIGPILALGKDSPNSKRSLFTVNMVVSLKQL